MEYTLNELEKMTNEEQLQLFLQSFHLKIEDASVSLPYISKRKHFCAGSYRLCPLNDNMRKMIYPKRDSYISVNTFLPGKPKKAKNTKSICGIFIDIDINHAAVKAGTITPEDELQCIDEVVDYIKMLIESDKIPTPWALMVTGSGIAIHYRYENLLAHEDADKVEKHLTAYQLVFRRFETLFKNERFSGIDIDVDTSVHNLDRVCRLPGTMNTKAGRYARLVRFWGHRYDPDKLYQAFGFTEEMLQMPAGFYKTNKKSKAKEKKTTAKPKEAQRSTWRERAPFEAYIPSSEAVPFAWRIHRNIAKFNLKCLDRCFEDRCWVEGAHRHRFLFIYYNCFKLHFGAVAAYQKCIELNNLMKEPLADAELTNIFLYTDEHREYGFFKGMHGDGVYLFMPSTIQSREWLNISDEESREYGFYDYQDMCREREERRAQDKERDRSIAELYQSGVTAYKTISRMIKAEHPEYRCSRNTVKNVLSRLNLLAEECQNGHAEGVKNESNCLFLLSPPSFGEEEGLLDDNDSTIRERELDSFPPIMAYAPKNQQEELDMLYRKQVRDSINAPNDEKDKALEVLLSGKNILLKGSAGTGKSTLIRRFHELLPVEERRKTLYLAFTGKASTKLPNGRTIHSAFELEPGMVHNFNYGRTLPEGIHRVVLDEVGMIRVDLFNYVINTINNTPWDVQLILLGDFSQTSAFVDKKEEARYKACYGDKIQCYESDLWNELELECLSLNRVERQRDEEFANALLKVRYGKWDGVETIMRGATKQYTEDDMVPYICPRNKIVNAINRRKMERFTDRIVFTPRECINVSVAEHTLELAVGMRVMTTRNEPEFKNGDVGTITRITESTVYVLMDETGAEVAVHRVKYEEELGEISYRRYKQFPICLAYAMTAEKSQGATFKEVNIIPGFFAPGQLYVALSRCESVEGIHVKWPFRRYELKPNLEGLRMMA